MYLWGLIIKRHLPLGAIGTSGSAPKIRTHRQPDSWMGVSLDKVFTEKISGKSNKRPILQQCLEHLRDGDTFHVHSMDRLARNLSDLQKHQAFVVWILWIGASIIVTPPTLV